MPPDVTATVLLSPFLLRQTDCSSQCATVLVAISGIIAPLRLAFVEIALISTPLARIIHEGSLRKRADAKRDGHSEA